MLSSTKQVWDYLEKQGYMLKDAQGNRMMLAHTLLLLAHCALQDMLPQGIQAVATILENEAVTKTVDAVMANIAKRIDLLLDLVEEAADMTQGVMMEARKAPIMLYSTCEDIRDEIHKAAEHVKEEMQRLAEGAPQWPAYGARGARWHWSPGMAGQTMRETWE